MIATPHKNRRVSLPFPEISNLRSWSLYQPLAIALVLLLLLPPISWLESTRDRGPFQAAAQIVLPGGARGNKIIQTVDLGGPGGTVYANDLDELESDAVKAYLALHDLPASDAHLIYEKGRADLRTAIRGTMMAVLLGIIQKPAAERTQHEKNLFSWFQTLVQRNEIAQYTAAVREFQRYQSDYCSFALDLDIARQYNLSYDGTPWCYANLGNLFGGPPVPAASYFTAYGWKNSYAKAASTYVNFPGILAGTQLSLSAQLGIAIGVGGTLAAGAAAALTAASAVSALTVFAAKGAMAASAVSLSSAVVSGATVSALSPAFVAAGPAAVILIAIAIGVAAGFQTFSNAQNRQDGENLSNLLTYATNNPPDLASFASISEGLLKLELTFASQTLPDVPSSATLPVHQFGADPNFLVTPSGETARTSTTFSYQDWNGANWSAQTAGAWFVRTCTSGEKCLQANSLSGSIQYLDWSGAKWTASRFGDNFVSSKAVPASTDQLCPANPATLVSSATDFSACSSYVSAAIPLKDASGANVTVSLSNSLVLGSDLQITSSSTVRAIAGYQLNFLVTTIGTPVPSLSIDPTSLPAGFTFTDNGNGTATIKGVSSTLQSLGCVQVNGAGCGGITATNSQGSVTQKFVMFVDVAPNPTLVGPPSATFTAGIPNSVRVTSTGAQTPVNYQVRLPDGVTWLSFRDNGDGTGVLSGTPPVGASGPYKLILFPRVDGPGARIILGPNYDLNITNQPAFVGGDVAQFEVGKNSSFSIQSTSTALSLNGTTLPQGLSFQSGLNNNIYGVVPAYDIIGTPAAGTGGVYELTVTATNASGSASKKLKLEVFEQPAITTVDSANFYAGTLNSFSVTTTGYPSRSTQPVAANPGVPSNPTEGRGMYFTVTGLPPGLQYSGLDPAGYATGTLAISGNPSASERGTHIITIKAINGVGGPGFAAEKSLTLYIGGTPGDVNIDGNVTCADVAALDNGFGKYRGHGGYEPRVDTNNDGVVDVTDWSFVSSHVPRGTVCPSVNAPPKSVFRHVRDDGSASSTSTVLDYVTTNGQRDKATVSKGIFTGRLGQGNKLVYVTWGGELWSASLLPDGVTFQHSRVATGEVRTGTILNYVNAGRNWTLSVIAPTPTQTVFRHVRRNGSGSYISTVIDYVTSDGKQDEATLSKGLFTGQLRQGNKLVYVTWGGELWSASVLPDGVTFQHTNAMTGEVRISTILNYVNSAGENWTLSVNTPDF
jgi:hypothetical protein